MSLQSKFEPYVRPMVWPQVHISAFSFEKWSWVHQCSLRNTQVKVGMVALNIYLVTTEFAWHMLIKIKMKKES